MAIRYFSDKTHQYYDTMEAANKAELEAKEKENLERVKREREERLRKEEREKVSAERKAMAEEIEAARKEMVAAQNSYREKLGKFINKFGTYHYSTTNADEIPSLFDIFDQFRLL